MSTVASLITAQARLPAARASGRASTPAVPYMRMRQRISSKASMTGKDILAASCSGMRLCPGSSRRGAVAVRASSENGSQPKKNTEFGYSRKDIILLGVGLIGLGYALYYGLQATGMEAGKAGNVVQVTIFMGICVGYISTYIFRVANKDMTYVKQLEDYEEAVMARRLSEMAPDELDRLMVEVDEETQTRQTKKKKLLNEQVKNGGK